MPGSLTHRVRTSAAVLYVSNFTEWRYGSTFNFCLSDWNNHSLENVCFCSLQRVF